MAEIKEQHQIVVYMTPDEFDLIDRALIKYKEPGGPAPEDLRLQAVDLWAEWERK